MMRYCDPEHWRRLHVVRCGVEVAEFQSAARSCARSSGVIRVLSVSRLVPAKGHSVLLEAIRDLNVDGREARLTIAGDGPDMDRLVAIAARFGIRKCRFSRNCGQADIRRLYAESDVFCLASFAEGIPVVLIEAMASGCPVIATQVMGIPELVEHDQTGLLVSPGDVSGLASAIARVADEPGLVGRLVPVARQRIEDEYSLTASASALSALFVE